MILPGPVLVSRHALKLVLQRPLAQPRPPGTILVLRLVLKQRPLAQPRWLLSWSKSMLIESRSAPLGGKAAGPGKS